VEIADYRGLLEAAPDAMEVVNRDGQIVLLNAQPERQFGYHRGELSGRNVKDIIPEGFAEPLISDALRTTAEAQAQQIGTGIELPGRRKDGTLSTGGLCSDRSPTDGKRKWRATRIRGFRFCLRGSTEQLRGA